ncbi:YceI family protein [Galactobacter valiniphilus]|uniref:Polyisoprenoid-binding protein n=1 Tax=Galactobacter valiniphilus TaxID=2676122 RepID=A0A399JEW4_9MICC|nr:YceI family protein [Galactobacter valiniphilus]RII43764.1 polyisoprenoid-binding protein [Galactobacter valiniphilus]
MTALPTNLTPGTWTIDPAHTLVGFSVRHAGISKVRGRFGEVEGVLNVGETVEDSSLTVEIKTASIDTRNQGRDDHLRSGDFFQADEFPTMKFVSLTATGSGEDWVMKGELTIKDVTREVELEVEYNGVATDPFGAHRAGFSAETTISRKEWGLTWNAALETGGVLVADKIKLELEAEFVRG